MDRIQQFRKRSRANTDVGKFFTTIEQIRLLVEDLEKWVETLKNKHAEILAIPLSNDNRSKHLEDINSKIKSLSQIIRSKLKLIEKSIQEAEPQPLKECVAILEDEGLEAGGGLQMSPRRSSTMSLRYSSAILRIRKTQFASLAQQFTKIMTGYQFSQVHYRDQLRTRLKRQLEITNSTVCEDAIDEWIDQGKMTIFTKSIIFDPKVVEDVQARHNDLIKLEKSIRDLNELFKDLAHHVEFQGHMVDNIEENVKRTAEFAEEALRHVYRAKIYQNSYRKKRVCLLTVAVFAALLILGIVIFLSIHFSTRKI